jgi:EamA domain-containing membrane protein RarD
MLSRLVLLVLQLSIAWIAAPAIVRYIPGLGPIELFVYAAVFAVVVWVVGLVLAQVLRETGQPSSSTLFASLVVALIGAALVTWLPAFVPAVRGPMRNLPDLAYPLIGAVLGYHLRR